MDVMSSTGPSTLSFDSSSLASSGSIDAALKRIGRRPTPDHVARRFMADVKTAVAGCSLTPEDTVALARALHAVSDAHAMSVTEFLRLQDDVTELLRGGGAPDDLVERVSVDLEDVFLALWR
jgi:hypothetical protein